MAVSFATFPFWQNSAFLSPHTWVSLEKSSCGTMLPFCVFPRGWCFAAAMWGDWTSNACSILGLHQPWASVRHRLWWEGALLDWAAQQFFCTWHDVYKHGLFLFCCVVGTWSQVPCAHSLLGRKGGPGRRSSTEGSPGPALSLACSHFGLVLLPEPLQFLHQSEDTGSEGFQAVLLLLWNVICDSD